MKGIDVSTHQKKIDWEKVKADGIEFAMLRAGYGNNNIDAYFVRNVKECNRLNIPVGVYWFSYAYTVDMARREARQCIEAIKPYKIDFPVVFDFEYGSVEYAEKKGVKITKQMATEFVIAFCDEVEKAGYHPMNYTNQDYMKRYFDMSKLKYDLWLALWPKSGKPDKDRSGECQIWQYTEKGRVNGIAGNVDMNIAYKHYGKEENMLKRGDKNEAVRYFQSLLLKAGYDLAQYGADGSYGGVTEKAVETLQGDAGLPKTGRLDIYTIMALIDRTDRTEGLQREIERAGQELARYKDFFAQLKSFI